MQRLKNKWMYATIGLAAVLALVITTPAAYAADKSHQDIINAINNAVTNLTNLINGKASQTSVNNLQTTANAIKTNTDDLAASRLKTVEVAVHKDIPDGGNEVLTILPFVQGKAYQGHMELALIAQSGNSLILTCGTENTGTGGFPIFRQDGGASGAFERDFSCTSLNVAFVDTNDGTNAPQAHVVGIVTYLQSSDVTSINLDDSN